MAERTFEELQKNPDGFNKACMIDISRKMTVLGIKVNAIDIKDVALMHSMVRSMA